MHQMRVLDANSAWFGVPVAQLMENSGKAVAAEANKLGESFAIICGPGNNGGDGFAAARYLKSKPKIFYFWHPRGNDAYDNFFKAKNYKPVQISEKAMPELRAALAASDVVIDAIFGTGIRGRIKEPFRGAIDAINNSGKKILSVDVPSGMDPDTGNVEDIAVKPVVTLCLHAIKPGLVKNKVVGKVEVADIGIHPKAYTHVGKGDFKFGYPRRKEEAHKGQAGRVLVVGGSNIYTGAPYFAAIAAMKAGCDLSYVAAPQVPAAKISTMAPDLIVYSLASAETIYEQDVPQILAKKFDVLCVGNGLGDKKESLDAAAALVVGAMELDKPIVVDGDALKAVKPLLPKLKDNIILTPHAGEFKALFGLAPNEENLKKVAMKVKCVILLKGHVDMIAQGGRSFKYNESGNPYMSKGGTGDVLAGLCAGYLAQGVDAFNAACFGAFVNGVAGDIAYSEKSISLLASDVLSRIGSAEKMLLE